MRPIDKLLPRLTRVKVLGEGEYRASCPTEFHHRGDHSAGLNISEKSDGKVLLHCPAGCTNVDVLEALALDWGDLFPDSGTPQPKHNYREILKCVADESTVVAIAANRLANGAKLKRDDLQRLASAAKRLRGAAEVACQM